MEIIRLDRLDPRNAEIYEESLKSYMDLQSAFSYQKKQGIAEGMQKGMKQGLQKGRLAIAKAMKKTGATDEFISQCTGMTPEEISNL